MLVLVLALLFRFLTVLFLALLFLIRWLRLRLLLFELRFQLLPDSRSFDVRITSGWMVRLIGQHAVIPLHGCFEPA